ncbi:MAG: hypothetical protein QW779_06615 [Nitrososphaerales archaeon]
MNSRRQIGWSAVEILKGDKDEVRRAKNFKIRLLVLFYEDLLRRWFEKNGYKVHEGRHPSTMKEEIGRWQRTTSL